MFQDPSIGEIKLTYVVTNITIIDPAKVFTYQYFTILFKINLFIYKSDTMENNESTLILRHAIIIFG